MKIFITGGTGIIGEELALGLRRQGHQVYALVRSIEKAKNLLQNEVKVIIGDISDIKSYKDIAMNCHILIHAAIDYTSMDSVDNEAVETLLNIAKDSNAKITKSTTNSQVSINDKKVLIYTSCILVYPDSSTSQRVYDENDSTDPNLHPTMKYRPDREQKVLKSADVSGVVVRPAFVFGKKSRNYVEYFKQATEGKVTIRGKPDIIWSCVHIDDLVDGYIRIVEASASIVSGQIFNFSDDSRYSNMLIAKTYSKIAGFHGEITSDLKGGKEYSNKSVIASSRKANRILNWKPNHLPMLDEIETYFLQWKSR